MISQEKFNEIARGMDEVNMKMAEEIERNAPMCHFRKMMLEQTDSVDGFYISYWECSVCGHTKEC